MCWDGMHDSASLTPLLAVRSAPFSRRRAQMAVWPPWTALCNAFLPFYNNRQIEKETETDKLGQGLTTGGYACYRGKQAGQGMWDSMNDVYLSLYRLHC